ncbi:MAG: MarC family protein [Opitutales bacterium]
MQSIEEIFSTFVILWAVIDPIGTVPVFIATTKDKSAAQRRRIALLATVVAIGVLIFFVVAGEIILRAMGVPLLAFQISGGLVLFLFALTMIFGESKPDEEVRVAESIEDTAVFPLATPSIASPGAMMALVLLTENGRFSILHQSITVLIMVFVVGCAYLMMRFADTILRAIGNAGANVVSRVMGLILASVAAANVLQGIKDYFG